MERYLLKQAGGDEVLALRVLSPAPATCDRLTVGDRVRITYGADKGKLGAVFKIVRPGEQFMVAIDGEPERFVRPGEPWHPQYVISALARE